MSITMIPPYIEPLLLKIKDSKNKDQDKFDVEKKRRKLVETHAAYLPIFEGGLNQG